MYMDSYRAVLTSTAIWMGATAARIRVLGTGFVNRSLKSGHRLHPELFLEAGPVSDGSLCQEERGGETGEADSPCAGTGGSLSRRWRDQL
jgi:hypothetical protein